MTNRVPDTAIGPMSIVAIEQGRPAPQRILTDRYARRMLPVPTRTVVDACRWGRLRDLLIRGTDRQAPGLWNGFLYRKRHITSTVAAAIDEGVRTVVVLGAGLDTLSLRLADREVTVFDVDLPTNIARRRRLAPDVTGRADRRLVTVDFTTEDVLTRLENAGYRPSVPTVFVWEAVTQYLTEDAVRATMSRLSGAASGSRLLFTYIRRDFLDGRNHYGARKLRRRFAASPNRLWHFGLDPQSVGEFLAGFGWTPVDDLGPDEYLLRYRPSGRDTSVSPIERLVEARI